MCEMDDGTCRYLWVSRFEPSDEGGFAGVHLLLDMEQARWLATTIGKLLLGM